MDRPLSQLVPPEVVFERREERPRCCKQRIVFLEAGKYSIGFPRSLYPGIRYPMPSTASGTALLIAARTCSSFCRTASGCAAMYSSTELGTLCFIPSFYVSACVVSSPISAWPATSCGDPFHTPSVLSIELCCMERRLGTQLRREVGKSRRAPDQPRAIPPTL